MYISVLLTLCLLLIKEVLFTYVGQCIFNDMFNDRMVFILKCLTYIDGKTVVGLYAMQTSGFEVRMDSLWFYGRN